MCNAYFMIVNADQYMLLCLIIKYLQFILLEIIYLLLFSYTSMLRDPYRFRYSTGVEFRDNILISHSRDFNVAPSFERKAETSSLSSFSGNSR